MASLFGNRNALLTGRSLASARPTIADGAILNALLAPLPISLRVINATNTSRLDCACGSWRAHCTREVGWWPMVCAVVGCNRAAQVAAHVRIAGPVDTTLYLVPTCEGCNHRAGTFEVSTTYPLVRGYESLKCGSAR